MNSCLRVQQPEPEVLHSDVIRTSSFTHGQDHVPNLVVSPASPSKDKKEFTFETVMSNSPPSLDGGELDMTVKKEFTFETVMSNSPPSREGMKRMVILILNSVELCAHKLPKRSSVVPELKVEVGRIVL